MRIPKIFLKLTLAFVFCVALFPADTFAATWQHVLSDVSDLACPLTESKIDAVYPNAPDCTVANPEGQTCTPGTRCKINTGNAAQCRVYTELYSCPSTEVTLPATPTGLIANPAACGSGEIWIAWNAVSGATGYELSQDGAVVGTGAYTLAVHQGLAAGSSHSYSVRALNSAGPSGWSSPMVTAVAPNACVVAPAAPASLTATPGACGTGQVILSWPASAGATSYTLRDGSTIIYTGANTSFTHTGLTAGSNHSYTVTATNAAGTSGPRAASPAATVAPAACAGTTLPATPTGLIANPAACGSGEIWIAWNAVSGATSYELSRDGNIINTGGITGNIHIGLAAGSSHSYSVRALNSAGPSGWSSPMVTAVAPNACVGVVPGMCSAVTPNSCTQGTLADLSDTSTLYRWNCNGSDNAATSDDVYCTLSVAPATVGCGASAGGTFSIAPTTDLCTAGSVAWLDNSGADGNYNWECRPASGSPAVCQATYAPAMSPERPSLTLNPTNITLRKRLGESQASTVLRIYENDGDVVTTNWSVGSRPFGSPEPVFGYTSLSERVPGVIGKAYNQTFSNLTTTGQYRFNVDVSDRDGSPTNIEDGTVTVNVRGMCLTDTLPTTGVVVYTASSDRDPPNDTTHYSYSSTDQLGTYCQYRCDTVNGYIRSGGACVRSMTGDISANPLTINATESTNVTWSATNTGTNACSVSPTGWTGTSGTQSDTPPATRTYVLSCGNTLLDSVTVTVNNLGTSPSITANPRVIEMGDITTLSYDLAGSPSCSITGGGLNETVIANDVRNVTLTATTKFTIDCGVSGSDTVTVEVVPKGTET